MFQVIADSATRSCFATLHLTTNIVIRGNSDEEDVIDDEEEATENGKDYLNDSGDRMLEMCNECGMAVGDTYFKKGRVHKENERGSGM